MHATAIIVDDEPLLRAELREALKTAWPELEVVAEAGDGVQAVGMTREFEPDIVFLDVQMPQMNGVDVAQRLRDRTLVVFLTAYDRLKKKSRKW